MLNLIQSSHAQPSPAGNGNTFSDGQTFEQSSGGGFPGLLSLASEERSTVSDGDSSNRNTFREHLSAEQSSGSGRSENRLSADHPSDVSSEDHLSKVRLPKGRSSEDGPSEDGPSEESSAVDRSLKDRSSGNSAVAGSLSFHFDSAARGQKKSPNSEKQPSSAAAVALLMNPLLGVYPPVAVPQTVPQAVSVSDPTSGSTTGAITVQTADLANPQTDAVPSVKFQGKLSPANPNNVVAADTLAKQGDSESVFPLDQNSIPTVGPWISGDRDGSSARDLSSSTASAVPAHQKKSADVSAEPSVPQSGTQAAPGFSDQNSAANSVPSNPASLREDVSTINSMPNEDAANSLPPDFQPTADAAVAATGGVPSVEQIAAGVTVASSSSPTDATSTVASPPSDGTIKPPDQVPQTRPGSPATVANTAQQNASPASKMISAKSVVVRSTTQPFASLVSNPATAAQAKPDDKTLSKAGGHNPSHSLSAAHHASTPGTSENAVNNMAAKSGADSKNSGSINFNNQGMASKDLAGKDLAGNDPGKDFSKGVINKDLNDKNLANQNSSNKDSISKDLGNKDLTSKDSLSKDSLSKDLHAQNVGSSVPNSPLLSAPAAVSGTSANPAANLSVDALSAPVAIGPQPAPNSSPGTSVPTANPSATPGQPDAATQQSAAAGNVQLARIADHAGQSEMHIGMRIPAFGSVEVHTSVHQSEVGITVGSEHGDLKTFLNAEIPALRDSLNQQNLQFSHLNFLGAGDSASSSFGGEARGNSQGFTYKQNFTQSRFHSEAAAITDSAGLEGEIFPAAQRGLSIHA